MNAKLPVLTITPEQLENFEWRKSLIDSDLECTNEIIDQLATLFWHITKATSEGKPLISEIENLAKIGHFICDSWSMDATRKNLKKLSPLNSTEI